MRMRSNTPVTRLGILSMYRDAMKIPNGAPKRPNIVMNCDCDVSYPSETSSEGIHVINVYWMVFIPMSTREPTIVLLNSLPLNSAEYGSCFTGFGSSVTGGSGLPVEASISFSIFVRISSASSTLPCASSHLGDSGNFFAIRSVARMDRMDGIMYWILQFAFRLTPVRPIRNAIPLLTGWDQFPMKELRLDHVPRFLPGTYSVNPAKRTTRSAPSPKPWISRNTYSTYTFGATAPPIMEMM